MLVDPQPATDAVWRVERNGINPIGPSVRHGTPRELFWIWFAGNLSFTYIVIGAAVWSYGLSLWQSLLALGLGLGAFVVLGYIALPGSRTGLPTMAYSSSYLGTRGSRAIAWVSWLNMIGWETVVLIIASDTIAALMQTLFGLPGTALVRVAALAVAAAAELSIAFLGHATIAHLHKWVAYLFGAATLLILLAFLPHVSWQGIWTHPAGSWLDGVVPATTLVVAVGALSWVTTAADYTRYLPSGETSRRIVAATSWGSIVPTALLMGGGLLLAQASPALAQAANPVSFLLRWLPAWAQVPYMLVTLVGILAGGVLCAYSSGLSLLAAGVKVPRSRTIGIDALISIMLSLYVLLVSQSFLGDFEGFLGLIAALLAPWVAVALCNLRHPRARSRRAALVAWLTGAAVALATTSTPLFTGPLARGIFATSALGYFVGFVLALLLYLAAARGQTQEPVGGRSDRLAAEVGSGTDV